MSSSNAAADQSAVAAQVETNPWSVAQWRTWVVENKLRAVGGLWAASIAGSLLVNFRKPGEKFSVKLIHARLHAQGLTLAALLAAAGVEYWERTARAKENKEVPAGASGLASKGLHVTS